MREDIGQNTCVNKDDDFNLSRLIIPAKDTY